MGKRDTFDLCYWLYGRCHSYTCSQYFLYFFLLLPFNHGCVFNIWICKCSLLKLVRQIWKRSSRFQSGCECRSMARTWRDCKKIVRRARRLIHCKIFMLIYQSSKTFSFSIFLDFYVYSLCTFSLYCHYIVQVEERLQKALMLQIKTLQCLWIMSGWTEDTIF